MTDDEILAQQMMQPARDTMAREELRDKFAMSAMSGLVSAMPSNSTWEDHMSRIDTMARNAYRIADAMLAARKAKL